MPLADRWQELALESESPQGFSYGGKMGKWKNGKI
jgi:hypothetical protein